jgi:hypothetical protein
MIYKNQTLNVNAHNQAGKVNALCKNTSYDRIGGNRANVPRVLYFTPGDESENHASVALPSGKDQPLPFVQEGGWAQGTV